MPADQSSPTPNQASPARVFATLSGAVLVIGGTVGFFHASTFGTPGEIEDALGFAVNGWINTLHIVVGALGLLAAGYAARAYSLAAAILFGALAIWGFATGSDDALLDRFPADEAQNLLHAALAVLGLSAWFAERPRREPKPKKERPPRAPRPDKDKKREEKQRREERKKRDEKRRAERRKREEASKSAGEKTSPQSESGDDPADRDDEPQTPPERPSRRRRRPRRPRA